MKAYTYWTNDKAVAATFARVTDAFLNRPHNPEAVPLDSNKGPYEFCYGIVGNESEDKAKIFEQFAKTLGMETQVLRPENPPLK